MKKMIFAGCLMAGASVFAQAGKTDSLEVVNLQEVQIVSTRATSKTPGGIHQHSRKKNSKSRTSDKISPICSSMTPSALTTSDAGAGIGYTTLRVRGTDGTRINITVNGIPMNDAESHNLFLGEYARLFFFRKRYAGAARSRYIDERSRCFRSQCQYANRRCIYETIRRIQWFIRFVNTHKETVKVGTGLLNNHWTFDARLSNIGTDGYIDRASVDLNSYYLQGGYFAENTSVKLIAFAGKEKTYHAWGYATKEQMEKFGRRYNPCGEMYTDANGKKYYYDDQTDNYLQKNYQLLFNHTFSTAWNLNVALHYTKGDGYYEEYKDGRYLIEYGLKSFTIRWNRKYLKAI